MPRAPGRCVRSTIVARFALYPSYGFPAAATAGMVAQPETGLTLTAQVGAEQAAALVTALFLDGASTRA